jgi:hypothetical protein
MGDQALQRRFVVVLGKDEVDAGALEISGMRKIFSKTVRRISACFELSGPE